MTDSGGARCVDASEVLALLCCCRRWRDRALFGSMALLGLRVSEACGLRVGDLWLADGTVRSVVQVRRGAVKGRSRSRQVPVPADLVALLVHWWSCHPDPLPDSPAFPAQSRTGSRPLHPRNASRLFREAAERAGLGPRVSTHSLRKFYAVELSRRGAEVRVIAALLGHASLSTTDVYLRQVQEWERVEAARSLSLPVLDTVSEVLRRLQRSPRPVLMLPDRRRAGGESV